MEETKQMEQIGQIVQIEQNRTSGKIPNRTNGTNN